MKTLIIILVMVLGTVNTELTQAQVSVRVNIGLQPIWGPVGYDYAEYYYLPDIAYYYVPERRFYYMDGGIWVSGMTLPGRYHDYDLYRAHKVVINEPRPYLHHGVYRERYGSYRGYHGQGVIRDSHENKYWEIKEHPEHGKWKGNEGRHEGNGNGNGHGHR
jgi:hypothetical protein